MSEGNPHSPAGHGPADFEALPDSGEGLARLYRAARRALPWRSLCPNQNQALRPCPHPATGPVGCSGPSGGGPPLLPPYLRVLGANQRGVRCSKAMDTDLPIVTKPAHGRGIALEELEARCTDFYGLCRRHYLP